jgi:hypothetical protein
MSQSRKVRLIEGTKKCRHLKKITSKGTLLQVFIRLDNFWRTFSHLVFSTQLCEMYSSVLPLSPSLWFNSPPSSPCVNKHTVYTIQCERRKSLWFWA